MLDKQAFHQLGALSDANGMVNSLYLTRAWLCFSLPACWKCRNAYQQR